MQRDNLLERLRSLDTDAARSLRDGKRYHVVIVGGSALILTGYLLRATADIDVLDASKVLYELFEGYDMNGRVNAFQDDFPLNYENRLRLIWAGEKIDFFALSLEDIVISKLCAGRAQDKEDILNVAEKINWEVLERLAMDENELKSAFISEHGYKDFLYDYSEFVRRCRP